MRTDGGSESDREEEIQDTDVQFRGFHRKLRGIESFHGPACAASILQTCTVYIMESKGGRSSALDQNLALTPSH